MKEGTNIPSFVHMGESFMDIHYLGTAAVEGWPAVFCECETCTKARKIGGKNIRTRSQVLIDSTLLVDLPPDTYYHAIREQIKLSKIVSLVVTHSHQDHFYPIELIMRGEPYAHIASESSMLTVYGNDKVHSFFNDAMKQDDSRNLKDRICFQEIHAFEPFSTKDGYDILPLLANHAKDEKCLIYIIKKDGKTILYGNDTGWFPEATWAHIANIHFNLVSLDCTCMGEKDGTYHMGLPDNIAVRKRLEEERCIDEHTQFVITHFSHNGKLMHDELVKIAQPQGFIAAYDGMTIRI